MTWEQVMELVKTQFVSTNCGGKGEIEEKENKQGMDLFIKYASEGFTEAYFTNNVILIERDADGEKCFYILDGERRVFILPGENEFIYIPFPSDISP